MKSITRPLPAGQQGAATLIIVMVLFLVMALLAAYANRSLLFEQRMASSYYRASLSQEAAEAGVEWTLAQLNGSAVDSACKPVTSGGQRFADKYLMVSAVDRTISSISTESRGIIDCARDVASDGWACRCPASNAVHTTQPGTNATGFTPSFGVTFGPSSRGGTVPLQVTGCTDAVVDRCNTDISTFASISNNQLARIVLTVQLGLVSAVRNPPASALTVRGNLQSAGANLGLHNSDARTSGLLVTLGGTWPDKASSRLESVPGTAPSQLVLENDATLNGATAEDVFKMFMGASVSRYPSHPAARPVTCDGDCTSDIDTAYKAGHRMLWIEGDMTLSSNMTLGSLADPVLIVVNGNVTLSGPMQINGMLVAKGTLSWSNAGAMPSLVNGMVLVGGDMTASGTMDVVYQQSVADLLRNHMGSYVRIPGGWSD